MAGTRLVIRLTLGEPEHVDGLCTNCWHSTLWRIKAYRLMESGVSTFADLTVCVDCGKRAR